MIFGGEQGPGRSPLFRFCCRDYSTHAPAARPIPPCPDALFHPDPGRNRLAWPQATFGPIVKKQVIHRFRLSPSATFGYGFLGCGKLMFATTGRVVLKPFFDGPWALRPPACE